MQSRNGTFSSLGYNGTSLDTIAREAGVAKKTLYHHFGNKEGLFTEIVTTFRRNRIAQLRDIVLGFGDPERVLTEVAMHLLEVFTRPERVKLHKLFLAEARRFPKLVRELYDSRGAMCGMEPLSNYLRDAAAHKAFSIDDANLATEQFVHMVIAGVRERLIVERSGGQISRSGGASRSRRCRYSYPVPEFRTLVRRPKNPGRFNRVIKRTQSDHRVKRGKLSKI